MKRSLLVPFLVGILLGFACGPETALAKDSSLASLRASLASGNAPVKIVCFGDSVTGLYYHTGGRRTYTDMLGIALKQDFPVAEVTMINAGISGHTTARGLERLERDVLAHQPDLVTVMYGLNDAVRIPIEDYERNLRTIVRRCREYGAEVVLCTPNAVITTAARPVEKLKAYCEVVRKVANDTGAPLCDSFAEFEALREADPEVWRLTLSDEIHPNMAGHKLIAEQLARTITGQSTSLDDIGTPSRPLEKTLALIETKKAVRILAMPPFDSLIDEAIRESFPEAELKIVPWGVAGMSMPEVMKDASQRVRKLKPDLVVVAVPRSAKAANREEFIRSQQWIVNYSLSFGKQEWDVVVVHPSVAEPDGGDPETDKLIRTLTAAHDLSLVDREPSDDRKASEILKAWLESQ